MKTDPLLKIIAFLFSLAAVISCSILDSFLHNPNPDEPTTAKWVLVSDGDPKMSIEFSMIYAPSHKKVIAFGGRDDDFNLVDETWGYDYETDSWSSLEPAISPPARASMAMAYDSKRQKIYIFGGTDFSRVFNDFWEYDFTTNSWTELYPQNPPEARQMHGMVYDARNDVLIMFGGRRAQGGASFNDTWTYHFSTNNWSPRMQDNSPEIQDHVNLTYDELHGKTVLFGGAANAGNAKVATWVYDYNNNTWTELSTEISPTADHCSLLYQSSTNKILLFGNNAGRSAMETWLFDYAANNWTRLASSKMPVYREHFGMTYMAHHDTFLLIGGFPGDDNWRLTVN